MSTLINFFGAPGSGKSTAAAIMFGMMKQEGAEVEFVQEYVKEWVWEGRKIGAYDQFYILGTHIRKETRLLNKVDYIITDSPVYLPGYYATEYCPWHIERAIIESVKAYYDQLALDGHEVVNIYLNRKHSYNPKGRNQNEEEARRIDEDMREFFYTMGVLFKYTDSGILSLTKATEQILAGNWRDG